MKGESLDPTRPANLKEAFDIGFEMPDGDPDSAARKWRRPPRQDPLDRHPDRDPLGRQRAARHPRARTLRPRRGHVGRPHHPCRRGSRRQPDGDRQTHGRARVITVRADRCAFGFPPGRTALVVIDMRRERVEPGGFGAALGSDVTRLRALIPAVASLLALFRARGRPVIRTREAHLPDLSDCPPPRSRAATRPSGAARAAPWAGFWRAARRATPSCPNLRQTPTPGKSTSRAGAGSGPPACMTAPAPPAAIPARSRACPSRSGTSSTSRA